MLVNENTAMIDFNDFVATAGQPSIQDVEGLMVFLSEEYGLTESQIIYHLLVSYVHNNNQDGANVPGNSAKNAAGNTFRDLFGGVLNLIDPAYVGSSEKFIRTVPASVIIQDFPVEIEFNEKGDKLDFYHALLGASQSYSAKIDKNGTFLTNDIETHSNYLGPITSLASPPCKYSV